jgi:predicted kinase
MSVSTGYPAINNHGLVAFGGTFDSAYAEYGVYVSDGITTTKVFQTGRSEPILQYITINDLGQVTVGRCFCLADGDSYRAFVRGKVLGFLAGTWPETGPKARERFALAHHYTQPRPTPQLLITSGVVGTGKSTIARHVAASFGAIVVRTDVVRKRLVGSAPTERHTAAFGEGLYTPEMTRRTYAECLRIAADLLASGWPVVMDGAFAAAAERDEARALASRRGVSLTVLWCDAPDAVLADRLRRRAADPREVSDARPELLARHRAGYEAPVGEGNVIRVDTTADPDGAATAVLRALAAA